MSSHNQIKNQSAEASLAREDAAFAEWLGLRETHIAPLRADREVWALIYSAFRRGVRFGKEEAKRDIG